MLHDHPLILSQPSKWLVATRKTQMRGAASALLCDCDDFGVFACSLHPVPCFHLSSTFCTYVISIPLLVTSFGFHCISSALTIPLRIVTTQDRRSPMPLILFSISSSPHIITVSQKASSYERSLLRVLWIHGRYSLSNYFTAPIRRPVVDSPTYTSSGVISCIATQGQV
jgi:hypothetical protein